MSGENEGLFIYFYIQLQNTCIQRIAYETHATSVSCHGWASEKSKSFDMIIMPIIIIVKIRYLTGNNTILVTFGGMKIRAVKYINCD